jgi:hypothetical protein
MIVMVTSFLVYLELKRKYILPSFPWMVWEGHYLRHLKSLRTLMVSHLKRIPIVVDKPLKYNLKYRTRRAIIFFIGIAGGLEILETINSKPC